MSQDENKISDQIDSGLNERDELLENITHLTAENARLKEDLICDVCAGNPGQFCACNGTGNILSTLQTIRQELFRVNKNNSELQEFRAKELTENARLREALEKIKLISSKWGFDSGDIDQFNQIATQALTPSK